MTISSTHNVDKYTGDGVVTIFPYTYRILADAHMKVYLDGVLQTSGYTVSGAGNSSGNVTFDTAPDVEIILQREVPLTQQTDYEEYDPFSATDHENALDKLTMIDQQQQEELDRALKSALGSDISPEFNLDENSPGKILEVSDDGLQIIAETSVQDVEDAEANAATSASNASASASQASASESHAFNWATRAEDSSYNDGVNPVNFSAYHYMKKSEGLVASGVSSRNGQVTGTGDVLTHFNAMDWTGHQYAGAPVTAFGIPANAIASFAYDTATYVWYGPKGVNVGLGGDYVAIAGDLVQSSAGTTAAGVSYDNTASGLLASDVQAAIDEVDAKVDAVIGRWNATAQGVNFTIPTPSSVNPDLHIIVASITVTLAAGTLGDVHSFLLNAGNVLTFALNGQTVNLPADKTLAHRGDNSIISLVYIGTDTWTAYGDLA